MNDRLRRPKGYLIVQWNDEPFRVYRNLVVDVGLLHLGDIMDGTDAINLTLTKLGAGSGSTAVAKTDTALETEIGKIIGQSIGYPIRDGDVLKNAFQVGKTELGGTWRELALFFDNNDMWCRVNVEEREKSDNPSTGDVVSVWYYCDLVN